MVEGFRFEVEGTGLYGISLVRAPFCLGRLRSRIYKPGGISIPSCYIPFLCKFLLGATFVPFIGARNPKP